MKLEDHNQRSENQTLPGGYAILTTFSVLKPEKQTGQGKYDPGSLGFSVQIMFCFVLFFNSLKKDRALEAKSSFFGSAFITKKSNQPNKPLERKIIPHSQR